MKRLMGLFLIVLAHESCKSDLTPGEVLEACRRDPSAECCATIDCANGSVCNFSYVCAQGGDHQVTCDAPTGDRKCHGTCDASHPCSTGQSCQSVALFDGTDTGKNVAICLGP